MEPTIYLFFNGNCLEAMTHYADVLGGEIMGVFRNTDAPDPASRMPGGDDRVMNMNMTLGRTTVMASDGVESMYEKPQGFRIAISPTSRMEFDRVYAALANNTPSAELTVECTLPGLPFLAGTCLSRTFTRLYSDGLFATRFRRSGSELQSVRILKT